jgi:hypothetical protein
MNNSVPAVGLGHFVMKVKDINISYQFYTKLGLCPFGIFPYQAKAGCPTITGRRRTREAPVGMAPALSWS